MTDLEEIKQRIDIVSLIGEYVTLKKAGRNFQALCPFHSEKTPSFVVSPERQIWHCFGSCGEGGDIFTFLMKVENLEFPEALEILAGKAGVKLTRKYQVTENQKLKEDIYTVNRLASNYYHYLLTKHQVGEKARTYLQKRQINLKISDTFSLGYAPQNWDSLTKFLRKKDYTDFILTKAGLALTGRMGKLYDRFRGRLIFTLRDHRGNVIGFSGRKLPGLEGEDKDLPAGRQEAKYINTSETPVYTKGNVFYGLDITREAIRKSNEAVIVEGEFDFLSSFQSGVANIVAIKGTALTVNQVNLLKRFTDTILLALDRDLAGDAAARRGIETAENAGLNIKVVNIPSGKDPDECIKEDAGVWKKAVAQSVSVYDYLLDSALSRFNQNEAYGKKKIVAELVPFYAKITNPIVQSHYITLLAKKIDTPQERLTEMIEKFNKGRQLTVVSQVSDRQKKKRDVLLEEYLLSLLLQAPQRILITQTISTEEKEQILQAIENPALKQITALFFAWIDKLTDETTKSVQFIKTLSEELVPHADIVYLLELGELVTDKNLFNKELRQTKRDLLKLFFRKKIRMLSLKIGKEEDEVKRTSLNEQFRILKENLKLETQGQ